MLLRRNDYLLIEPKENFENSKQLILKELLVNNIKIHVNYAGHSRCDISFETPRGVYCITGKRETEAFVSNADQHRPGLSITRKAEQSIIIYANHVAALDDLFNKGIKIRIDGFSSNQVRLHISAPQSFKIIRDEIFTSQPNYLNVSYSPKREGKVAYLYPIIGRCICGHTPVVLYTYHAQSGKPGYYVVRCTACSNTSIGAKEAYKAIYSWNRDPQSDGFEPYLPSIGGLDDVIDFSDLLKSEYDKFNHIIQNNDPYEMSKDEWLQLKLKHQFYQMMTTVYEKWQKSKSGLTG